MGNNDLIVNIVFGVGLIVTSTIAYIAIDQKKFGKAAFFIIFALTLLRTLVQRWLAGLTDSNFGPNNQLASFLKSNDVVIVIYSMLFIALIWFCIEEVFEYRSKRKLKRFAASQLKTIDDKNIEIKDLKTSIEHEKET